MSTVSNLIEFRTLKKPSFKNITQKDDNQAEIEVELKCKFTIEDLDLEDDVIKQKLDPYNICDHYNLTYNSLVSSISNCTLIIY